MTGQPLGYVVIPAHDEAGTIAAGLRSLLQGSAPGELAVVVACNGCTDTTAETARATARALGREVTVLELAEPGKAKALRAVEQLGLGYPRLYLDADVQCPASTARALLRAVTRGHDLAVPSRHLDLDRASRPAVRYYRTWAALPWVEQQLAGRGAYAVGAALRDTFAAFPDVVADDRYVTTSVPRDRATVVPEAVTIRPPGRLADVVRVRSRVYAGNVVVDAPTHDEGTGRRSATLLSLAKRPSQWSGLAVFVGVSALAKLRAGWAVRRGRTTWHRDSARTVAV